MAQVKAQNRMLWAIMIVLGLVMAVAAGPKLLGSEPQKRKVTFYGQVGDGQEWAGGFTMTVTVNFRSTPYTVKALSTSDKSINTFSVVKTLPVGTTVAVLVTAEWTGKACKAQLRGFGVDTRPATAVSPQQPFVSAVIK